MLDDDRSEVLTKIVDILARLHDTTVQRGEPLLASLIAIAMDEAEDTLRHANKLAELTVLRDKMASKTSWQEKKRKTSRLKSVGPPSAVPLIRR